MSYTENENSLNLTKKFSMQTKKQISKNYFHMNKQQLFSNLNMDISIIFSAFL